MKNGQTDSQMASFSNAGRPFSPGWCPLVEIGRRGGISRTWGYKRARLTLEGKFLSRTQPFGRVCVQKGQDEVLRDHTDARPVFKVA